MPFYKDKQLTSKDSQEQTKELDLIVKTLNEFSIPGQSPSHFTIGSFFVYNCPKNIKGRGRVEIRLIIGPNREYRLLVPITLRAKAIEILKRRVRNSLLLPDMPIDLLAKCTKTNKHKGVNKC